LKIEVETPDKPFFLENSSLIQISQWFIYTYFYDQVTESYYIKVLSKLTGGAVDTISIGKEARIQCVKLDNFSGIIVKEEAMIKYYKDSKLLFKTENTFFSNFDSIDITKSNQLFHLKRYKKLFLY
jgi:hypothetical protein